MQWCPPTAILKRTDGVQVRRVRQGSTHRQPGEPRQQQDEEAHPPQPAARPRGGRRPAGARPRLHPLPEGGQDRQGRLRAVLFQVRPGAVLSFGGAAPALREVPVGSGNGSSALLDPRAARQALSAARGKEKVDLLLSAPDPEALVQSLPPHDLYLAVLEVGPDDAAEVVALASPQQFRHFVDLAAWPRGDEGPDPRAVLRWLHLARDGGGQSDRARRRYLDKLALLDAEMRSLVLRKALRVHDLQEETEPAIADFGRTFRTPEGRYIVEFLPGAGEYGTLKELLEDLYGEDVLGTSRLLESLRWEVPTELEEAARRWRDGRLRDLGFPDLDEALSFYARPGRFSTSTSTSTPASTSLAVSRSAPNLLERALARLDGEERDRAEEGLVYALNAALVANAVPLDDAEEVRASLADARGTLSLGLELLSRGEEQAAARALAERPVREIFQDGLSEAYRLQSR